MLKELKEILGKGININNKVLKMEKVSNGRFEEEENFVFYLDGKPILNCKLFYGRKPYYREWAEIFGIRDKNYFGSDVEKIIISIFYRYLEPGGKIFIEYEDDEQTSKELERGVPEVISRMGFLLFKSKFIYIKNLYFPEGFMEGGRKLKAEKPLSKEDYLSERRKILKKIKSRGKIYKRMKGGKNGFEEI